MNITRNMLIIVSISLICTSCATMFYGKKSKITVTDPHVKVPVTLTVGGERYENILLPTQVKIKKGFSSETIIAEAEGYEPYTFNVGKKFNELTILNMFWGLIPGILIDTATGALMLPESGHYTMNMQPAETIGFRRYITEAAVDKKDYEQSTFGQVVLRCKFNSDPQGLPISWRIISNIPDIVKNTEEFYLAITPYEETRSFNILGLTYENSRDVTIEVKVSKKGYEDQVKRFNVRQAIDQQEISGFFELVEKGE